MSGPLNLNKDNSGDLMDTVIAVWSPTLAPRESCIAKEPDSKHDEAVSFTARADNHQANNV